MPVQKIKSGRIITVQANTYVGDKGVIFYDEDTPELRLSDGVTPGGILIATGSTGTVSDTFKTIAVSSQSNLVASGVDTLTFVAGAGILIATSATSKSITITNDVFNATLDGGYPNSIYGGLSVVDGGGI